MSRLHARDLLITAFALLVVVGYRPSRAFCQAFASTPPAAEASSAAQLSWRTPQLHCEQQMAWDLPASTVAPAPAMSTPPPNASELQLFASQPLSPISQVELPPQLLPLSPDVPPGLHLPIESPLTGNEVVLARPASVWGRLWQDELNFYSPHSLGMVGGGLAVGAIMANTSIDSDLQSHLQSSLHHANSDDWLESLHANKELGDGRYTIPIFAGAWIVGGLLPESHASETMHVWGERTLRGFVVGAPPVLALQVATGGSRPGETSHGSDWAPFQDNNGVSGHSFMGALPFITAAKMTDSKALKATFYAASTLAPLSRTADGAHYPSQAALGWWMAFVAASAVHATDQPDARLRFYPTNVSGGTGMAMEYRF